MTQEATKAAILEFCLSFEKQYETESDRLEEIHMEAAIDASTESIMMCDHYNNKKTSTSTSTTAKDNDDLVNNNTNKNPYSVLNCLSPYVPTKAHQIVAFMEFIGLIRNGNYSENSHTPDTLLDIGCGDGRVCIASTVPIQVTISENTTITKTTTDRSSSDSYDQIVRTTVQKAIGFDISPPCIQMANFLAKQHNVENLCSFYQVDATQLYSDFKTEKTTSHNISSSSSSATTMSFDSSLIVMNELRSVTVIFLYTYPTLLDQLIPLLAYLMNLKNTKLRAVVTLTYHIPLTNCNIYKTDPINNLCWYSTIY